MISKPATPQRGDTLRDCGYLDHLEHTMTDLDDDGYDPYSALLADVAAYRERHRPPDDENDDAHDQ